MRNWTVEYLGRDLFMPKDWDWRSFASWTPCIREADRMTKEEAMHIIRMFPAFDLCARQID